MKESKAISSRNNPFINFKSSIETHKHIEGNICSFLLVFKWNKFRSIPSLPNMIEICIPCCSRLCGSHRPLLFYGFASFTSSQMDIVQLFILIRHMYLIGVVLGENQRTNTLIDVCF
jgi:hypothetical protein